MRKQRCENSYPSASGDEAFARLGILQCAVCTAQSSLHRTLSSDHHDQLQSPKALRVVTRTVHQCATTTVYAPSFGWISSDGTFVPFTFSSLQPPPTSESATRQYYTPAVPPMTYEALSQTQSAPDSSKVSTLQAGALQTGASATTETSTPVGEPEQTVLSYLSDLLPWSTASQGDDADSNVPTESQ